MNISELECPYCNVNPFLLSTFTCNCGYVFGSWTDFLTIFSTRIRHLQEELAYENTQEYKQYEYIAVLKKEIKRCSRVVQYLDLNREEQEDGMD